MLLFHKKSFYCEVFLKLVVFFSNKHCAIVTDDNRLFYILQPNVERNDKNSLLFGYLAVQKRYYILTSTKDIPQKTIFDCMEEKETGWVNLPDKLMPDRDSYLKPSVNLLENQKMGKTDEAAKKVEKKEQTIEPPVADKSAASKPHKAERVVKKSHKKKSSSKSKEKEVKKEVVLSITLEKPRNCQQLARYYSQVSQMEQTHLSQQIIGWINSGRFPLTGETWQDAIGLLDMSDEGISNTWLQHIYGVWQTSLTQAD